MGILKMNYVPATNIVSYVGMKEGQSATYR